MNICPRCKAENKEGATVCSACGEALSPLKTSTIGDGNINLKLGIALALLVGGMAYMWFRPEGLVNQKVLQSMETPVVTASVTATSVVSPTPAH